MRSGVVYLMILLGIYRQSRPTLEKVYAYKRFINSIQAEIKRLEELIAYKKRQLNNEGKGALLVNKYLTDFFGHEFPSLKAIEDNNDGEKKIRFEIVRNGRRAYHLSEGECSLISFCYFVAKLNDVDIRD